MLKFARRTLAGLAAAIGMLLAPASAEAGTFLSGYTGNTVIGQPTPATDGVVNFGVYQTSGTGNFITEMFGNTAAAAAFQAANPTADLNARFVYVFSVVNTGLPNLSAEQTLTSLTISTGGHATSIGAFQGPGNLRSAFTDGDSTSTPGTFVGGSQNTPNNRRLGPDNTPYSSDILNGAPSYRYSNGGANINDVGLTTVQGHFFTGLTQFTSSSLTNGSATFTVNLSAGQSSTLFFFTSDGLPTGYGAGTLTGANGGQSFGDLPMASPEPATMLMIGLGVSLVGGLGLARRMRKGKVIDGAVA